MTSTLKPLISVVIPTRGRPELLMNRSLPSALAQSHEPLEVVVVVDGPDPVTEQLLAELAAHDPRVRPIFLPRNVGGSDARNAGVQAASGEWISFLDDDDEWLPHKLTQQLKVVTEARQEGVRWPISVCGSITRTLEGDTPNPPRMPDPGEPLGDYMLARRTLHERECGFMTSAIFCSRELLIAHPFRSGLPRHQDWDWVLRVNALEAVRFLFSFDVGTIWYFGENRRQISSSLRWQDSLSWILECRRLGLVTGRAAGSFINATIADYAKRNGQYRALLPLSRAMLSVRPGAFELFRFMFIWSVPNWLRYATRAIRYPSDRAGTVRPAQPSLAPARHQR